jgi:hypothetical protein
VVEELVGCMRSPGHPKWGHPAHDEDGVAARRAVRPGGL